MPFRQVLLAAAMAACGVAHAQGAIPRTADGHPDFQGVWESRWRTPLERPVDAEGPVVAADKADALVAAMNQRLRAQGNQSPDSDFDFGSLIPAPGGSFRTSQIVEPADGKRPLNEAAQEWAKIVKDRNDGADGPEARGLTERCLRAAGGAPLATGADQAYRKIIQTPDHIVIWSEGLGDTRIIEMNGRPRPDAVVSWAGDSAGRWEGDVLVVETRLVRPDPARPAGLPGQQERKLTERFQLNAPDELGYSYTINDPVMFTTTLRVTFPLLRTNAGIYESACHEGNYGLANILSGARMAEARTSKPKADK
ncbi:MAG: hypothetical protein QM773_14775 [Hyphomonadaceae bacterium]